MRVEFETSGERSVEGGGGSYSKDIHLQIVTSSRYQQVIQKDSIDHIRLSSPNNIVYPPIVPPSNLYDFHGDNLFDTPEWKKATPFSPSDIERAQNYPERKVTSERAIKQAVFGIGGHVISSITNEITRQLRNGETVRSVTKHTDEIKPHERQLVEYIAAPHVARLNKLRPRAVDIPYFSLDIWRSLKNHYAFAKRRGNSKKGLKEGTVYRSEQVKTWWKEDMEDFEIAIAKTFERRFRRNELTLESLPGIQETYVEKSFRNRVDWGPFAAQNQGVIDYLLKNNIDGQDVYLLIDNKFHMGGSEPDYLNKTSLAQSLLYSGLARSKGKYDQGDYTRLIPSNTVFLYHVFSLSGNEPYSYYVDATVYPDRLQEISDFLTESATTWWFYHKELNQIKKEERMQIVMPYIANPRDEGVAMQYSLF